MLNIKIDDNFYLQYEVRSWINGNNTFESYSTVRRGLTIRFSGLKTQEEIYNYVINHSEKNRLSFIEMNREQYDYFQKNIFDEDKICNAFIINPNCISPINPLGKVFLNEIYFGKSEYLKLFITSEKL